MNLTKSAKLTRVIDATAAGTTDVNSSAIDMQGYDSVTFIVGFGTITASAVTSIKVQQAETDGSPETFADLEGTAISVADDDDNQIVAVEVVQPRERFLRVVVDRGTQNAVIDFGIALQNKANAEPVTHDSSTVVGSELHVAPAEGTA